MDKITIERRIAEELDVLKGFTATPGNGVTRFPFTPEARVALPGLKRELHIGDIVKHFKRETIDNPATEYLYKIIAFAHHSETDEMLVVYEALYPPFKTCARPYDMFMSEVDREKYPEIKQKYRFEVVQKGDKVTE